MYWLKTRALIRCLLKQRNVCEAEAQMSEMSSLYSLAPKTSWDVWWDKKVFWSWNSEDVQHVFLTLFFGFCSFETNKADSSFLWWVGRQKPDGVTSTFLVSCLHYWLMTTVAHWRGCPFLSISANWSPCRMLTWRHTWGHTLHTMKIYKHSCSLKVEISQKFCKHSCSLSTCHHLLSPGACDSLFDMKLNMITIPVFFCAKLLDFKGEKKFKPWKST